jgi:hypothetical protein
MHIACWVTRATNIHSEYAVFIDFPQQQWLHESALELTLRVHCLSCSVQNVADFVWSQKVRMYNIKFDHKESLLQNLWYKMFYFFTFPIFSSVIWVVKLLDNYQTSVFVCK